MNIDLRMPVPNLTAKLFTTSLTSNSVIIGTVVCPASQCAWTPLNVKPFSTIYTTFALTKQLALEQGKHMHVSFIIIYLIKFWLFFISYYFFYNLSSSTWTIDLCYLLSYFRIKHKLYTASLGVDPSLGKESFYESIIERVSVNFILEEHG